MPKDLEETSQLPELMPVAWVGVQQQEAQRKGRPGTKVTSQIKYSNSGALMSPLCSK